ncbi:MAG: Peptidase propeptide [Candidatus Acidoferrum typicum]|nr:Peptidase propeptide [Candidatus Acidoferrum typicum]
MRTFPSLIRVLVPCVSLFVFCNSPGRAQTSIVPARITQSVDHQQTVTLRGSTHPLARPEFDHGAVSDAMPMGRVLLLLQRSQDQELALQQMLEQQQSKSSPNYHAWLTPEQFGQQFGAADADIQVITQWLASQGFSQINAGPGRMVIEFSGTAGQVRSAFHTEIHHFVVNGEEHTANAADPQIPAALAPVVAGVVSLHNFPKRSHANVLGEFRRKLGEPGLQPLLTFPNPFRSGNFYGLAPGDFATIYNTKPLLTAGNDGTGQTIAIVGETNLNVQDVQQFRSMFGLLANFDASNIVVNGTDPGITSTDEETEADLDVQWSGAVAPGATIKFVVSASTPASAGIDLSALYIVEHNFAAVMSESYGACEKVLGTAGSAFYNNLWEQAAAQGITVVVSSGDGGSAGCDDFNKPQPATQGLAVSGLASTPYNVSVGGTDFDQVNNWAAYWNATNNATGTSAKSYIPEIPWSQSCAQIGLTGCGSSAPQGSVNIVAGSGGPSAIYPKPKWQLGVAGMPNDSHRDQPDVSLFASVGFNGTAYVLCQGDRIGPCYVNSGSVSVELVGGTSASAPAFAGVMALVNQKQSNTSNPAPRQGNANNVLYALAKKSGASCTWSPAEAANCVFNDVTKGNSFLPTRKPGVGTNSVPCQAGSLDCSTAIGGGNGVLVDPAHTTLEAWTAIAGYDMTTGLGSVNVNNLATAWGTASTIGTTTTLTLSPTTGIKHGSSENVGVNVTVAANTGTGTPTGDVSLIASFAGPPPTTQGLDHFTLSSTGAVTNATTQSLPGGTYNVTAHYAGDGTNAPSDSSAVQVTVATENSQTFVVVPTFDSTGNLVSGNANSVTYGSNYIIRMYATNSTAAATPSGPPAPLCAQINQLTCPSGTVTLTGNGTVLDAGTFPLNSAAYTRDLAPNLTAGTYSLVAKYSGDNSYSASSTTGTFTVAPAPTSLTEQTLMVFQVANQPFQMDIQGSTQALHGVAPTGTVTFLEGSTQLGAPVNISGVGGGFPPFFNANAMLTIATAGPHTITAQYGGDVNYAASSTSISITLLNPTSASISVNPTTVTYGSPVTITAVIATTVSASNAALKPTGNVNLYASYDGAIANPSITQVADGNGNWEIQVTATITPQSSELISLNYYGDSNYGGSSSNSFITVNIPDFSLTVPGPLVATVGQSGSVQINVVPASNIPSPVTLSCYGGLPNGYACSVQPNPVNLANGATSAATLTLSPAPAAQAIPRAALARNHVMFWPFGSVGSNRYGSLTVAMGLLTGYLLLWSSRRIRLRPALACGVACVIGLLGCGGGGAGIGSGGGGGGGGGGTPGPFTTSTSLSISAPTVASGSSLTVTAKVTGQGNPTGMVTFQVGGFWFGQANLVGDTATVTSNAPFPGLYQVMATYNGDASHSPSTSAPVKEGVTGSTSVLVIGRTGSLSQTVSVTITLQ